MCGIVGAIATRDVSSLLVKGLKRLEYRGYDSAGIAVINGDQQLKRQRTLGKVQELVEQLNHHPLSGTIGIAHTRWATHGKPSEVNAHPHVSNQHIAVVHNGIIENHEVLRSELKHAGYTIDSETDTELVAHLIDQALTNNSMKQALYDVCQRLTGAYALAVIDQRHPNELWLVRRGSALVIGVGHNENFAASDPMALFAMTQKFIYLEENDFACITVSDVTVYDETGTVVKRDIIENELKQEEVEKGTYRHYMEKEIYEQPIAIRQALQAYYDFDKKTFNLLTEATWTQLDKIKRIHIIACGTSFYAGFCAQYWLETIAQIPCKVEVASEFRYREPIVEPNTLMIVLSQSGETADTLAALRISKALGYTANLAICNVPQSTMVREADYVLQTFAGPEVSVASTKAFTTQLTVMLAFTLSLAIRRNVSNELVNQIITELPRLPQLCEQVLELAAPIREWAAKLVEKEHALFLGRGALYPVALEGALKLKELSYIHAEAYPAGELKHGPLALVDRHMPVITVVVKNEVLQKVMANLEEVKARGGQQFIFADQHIDFSTDNKHISLIRLPAIPPTLAPILYALPLQLLSYYVAVFKGTDVDQPRNLAKSVTVE